MKLKSRAESAVIEAFKAKKDKRNRIKRKIAKQFRIANRKKD